MAKEKPVSPLRCQPCKGSGRVWGTTRRKVTCRSCNGTGRTAVKGKT